jgi:hypothetical protein
MSDFCMRRMRRLPSEDSGMKGLAMVYPESVLASLNMSPESFEQEARMVLAVKLDEMGR